MVLVMRAPLTWRCLPGRMVLQPGQPAEGRGLLVPLPGHQGEAPLGL